MANKIKLLVLCLCVGLACSLYGWWQWSHPQATLVFCDVGQGDAILLTFRSTQLLVDGGPVGQKGSAAVIDCLNQYMPVWDRTIEVVISTHPDADHLAGLVPVFRQFTVQQLYIEGRAAGTKTFSEFQELVLQKRSNGLEVRSPKQGDEIWMNPEISAEVIFPFQPLGDPSIFEKELSEKDLLDLDQEQNKTIGARNSGSIALILHVFHTNILLTSDLEKKEELAITQSGLLRPVHIMKAGHHGSKTSNSYELLSVVKPEVFVISCGLKNRYGHPHLEVLRRVEEFGPTILRTDQLHDVVFTISSRNYLRRGRWLLKNL